MIGTRGLSGTAGRSARRTATVIDAMAGAGYVRGPQAQPIHSPRRSTMSNPIETAKAATSAYNDKNWEKARTHFAENGVYD